MPYDLNNNFERVAGGAATPAPAAPKPPDLEAAWRTWKAAPPSPAANAVMLTAAQPAIMRAASAHVPGGDLNPLARSRARSLGLEALRSYDPTRGAALTSHLHTHMQRMRRYSAQLAQGVHIPERVVLDRRAVDAATQELRDELGRDPADDEIADRTGLSTRRIGGVRRYNPAVAAGRLEAAGEAAGEGGGFNDVAVNAPGGYNPMWLKAIRDDLEPVDQLIFDMAMRPNADNREIARRVGLTPGAVSQRKLKLQQMIDRESELSPF